jgi:taurine dioxygenase
MALKIRPLSDALGAEVSGLDATKPLAAPDVAAINEAFLDRHLLCIRAAPLEPAAFDRLARAFGEPKVQLLRDRRHGEVNTVSLLESTYKTLEAKPDDLAMVRLSGWHTDDSYFAAPAKATMLQSLALPSSGGETRFCNTRRAYEELPAETKSRLAELRAVHCYDTMRAKARAVKLKPEEAAETPDVVHPLVRTHEDTGAKAIYFNPNRTDRVEGMDRAESDRLLDMLHAHMTQPKYRYDHQWRLGDVLLWDNRCLVHSVNVDFPVGERRLHQRILLEGVRPR